MSLLSEINGSLLLRLGGTVQSAESDNPLDALGISAPTPTSAREEAALISLGLPKAVSEFSASAGRFSVAYSKVTLALDTLTNVGEVVGELKALASQASDLSTSDEERARLNVEFRKQLRELETALDAVGATDEDYLARSDLAEILETAGADLQSPTVLAQNYDDLGGSDGQIGYEKVDIGEGTKLDPYEQTIADVQSAQRALEVMQQFSKIVSRELDALTSVKAEVLAANVFAATGAEAFYYAQGQVEEGVTAGEIASLIVRRIRQQSGDGSIAEHSNIDRKLAASLLSPD